MPTQRQWIVGIRFEDRFPASENHPGTELIEAAHLVHGALDDLAGRIEGGVVLAAVPLETNQVDLLLGIARENGSPPIHLIMPQESAERFGSPGASEHDKLGALCEASASINVQPGRGVSDRDWKDCVTWLESVSEIELIIAAIPKPETDSARLKPAVRITPASGAIDFTGFPSNGKLNDSDFNGLVKTAFKNRPLPDSLEDIKAAASVAANRSAPLTRILESGSLLLNLAPSLIAGVGLALLWMMSTVNLWTFLLSLAAALAALGLSRLGPTNTWLSGRVAAEICRSLIASRNFLDPLFPPASAHLPAYRSLIQSLSLSDAASRNRQPVVLSEARDAYVEDRLDGQIRYFRKQANRASRREGRIKALFYIATILAFVANLIGLLYYLDCASCLSEAFYLQWVEGFSTWVFPAIAAGAIGFLGILEISRRAHVYQTLADQLASRRKILSELKSESSITEGVRDIEDFLTAELADWLNQRLF